jgi:hypothetical protein
MMQAKGIVDPERKEICGEEKLKFK